MSDAARSIGKKPSWQRSGFGTPQFVLSLVLTLVLCGLFWRVLSAPIPDGSGHLIYYMMGQFMTVWGAAVGYFVWTSYSSSKKTDMLAQSPAVKLES